MTKTWLMHFKLEIKNSQQNTIYYQNREVWTGTKNPVVC